jgi:CheY-like chemotaxis protein
MGLKLLVAEDNPVNRLIVGVMLERLGAQAITAEDGAQAVALVQQHVGELHAVLMDLHMPQLDGLQATRLLRADAATARLPIYALSAAVLEQEKREAAAAGMDGFIDKPVQEADLVRVLGPLAAQRQAG